MLHKALFLKTFELRPTISKTILGKGGFGIVYKGILKNGVVVAVKVLSTASHQGVEEFLNEVFAKMNFRTYTRHS